MQWFFKEEVKSHGWYTAELRRAAVRCRGEILQEFDLDFLLQVADHLFTGGIIEDKNVAVFLLENLTDRVRRCRIPIVRVLAASDQQLG